MMSTYNDDPDESLFLKVSTCIHVYFQQQRLVSLTIFRTHLLHSEQW